MKSNLFALALALAAASVSHSALAVPKTVVLSIPGMTCSACPITVKKALEKIPGVEKVKVTYEPKEAIVTFDDAKTSVGGLTHATEQAGYPSSVISGK